VKQFPRESAGVDKERVFDRDAIPETGERARVHGGLSRGWVRSRTPGPHYPGDYGKVTSCQEWCN